MPRNTSAQQKLSVRAEVFHTFYQDVFGSSRWNKLFAALIKPTDLVAIVNPYVPTRWIARELGQLQAKPTSAFNTLFTKGLLIFELPNHEYAQTVNVSPFLSENPNMQAKDAADSLQDVEERGFSSRWPVRLPKVGHQPGDNQLDVALATNGNVSESSIDPNHVNTDEHIRLNGGFVSGFGPRKDKLGWYLMDLASISAPLILNPQPGEKVLDLCAAPGGKSLILAYLLFFRHKLSTRNDDIQQIITRFSSFAQQPQLNVASTANSFDDECSIPLDLSSFSMLIEDQTPEQFSALGPNPAQPPSLKRFRKFEQRYIYQHVTNLAEAGSEDAPGNRTLSHEDTMAAYVSYENDEILKAITVSRYYIEKTQNELDKEFHEKSLDPTVNKEILVDLQHEREMRMLHSKVLNPTTTYAAKNLDSTTSLSDYSHIGVNPVSFKTTSGMSKAYRKKRANRGNTTSSKHDCVDGECNHNDNAPEEYEESDSESDLSSIDVKRRRQTETFHQSGTPAIDRTKLSQLRLKSRLVLNDVSIPRVKRLHKVIQSYLPIKYLPLVEITNIDASTAQQFTLITRTSRGDISVKKKVNYNPNKQKDAKSAKHPDNNLDELPPGEYDCVLVDAPCSSDRHIVHDNALANWSLQQTKIQAKRQYSLLMAAIKSLKIGGRCVYSTCSLSPFENDGVVQKVCKSLGDAVKIVHFKLDIGEKTGCGWILLPDQPNCSWGPLYMSLLYRVK